MADDSSDKGLGIFDESADQTAFGVSKPVGYVVISLPDAASTQAAVQALGGIGKSRADIHAFTDKQALARADRDIANASSMAAIGQELNLVKAARALAERGYHFLYVKYDGDDDAQRIADTVKPLGANRAQRYGRFLIEELIEHPDDLPQVAESPDRGLDAQTPTGKEAERAERDNDAV